MKILVVGSAGYIGSHMVKRLGQLGCRRLPLITVSNGHRDAVIAGEFIHGNIADRALLDRLFESHKFDAVMHFASFFQEGESMPEPMKYYQNSLVNALNLLNAMQAAGVLRFIFSSAVAILASRNMYPLMRNIRKCPSIRMAA